MAEADEKVITANEVSKHLVLRYLFMNLVAGFKSLFFLF